jgi:tRNA(fMet)-specific endonuclease VapC
VKYLLDTNVCIVLMNESSVSVRSEYRECHLGGDELYLSSVSLFELTNGVSKSALAYLSQNRLYDLLNEPLDVLPFTRDDAAVAGHLRAELERRKQPIGPYDTLIAGQALARGLTLVTGNVREFERVDGLKWVDWAEMAR